MKLLGIDITSVSATAEHELGLIVEDPRGGQGSYTRRYNTNGIGTGTTAETTNYAPGKRYMYVRADAAIAQYDGCMFKLGETDDPFAVVKTADASSFALGVAEQASIDANDYFWLTIEGYIPVANVADAVTAGQSITPSATAGRFDATAAAAGDARIIAVTDGNASNQAAIYIMR